MSATMQPTICPDTELDAYLAALHALEEQAWQAGRPNVALRIHRAERSLHRAILDRPPWEQRFQVPHQVQLELDLHTRHQAKRAQELLDQ